MLKRIICVCLVCALMLAVFPATATAASIKGEFQGHTYQVFDSNLSWSKAKAYCESVGGHLVTISSQEENDFVYNLAKRGNHATYHIGYRNVSDEGVGQWENDEDTTYTNWLTNEDGEIVSRGYENGTNVALIGVDTVYACTRGYMTCCFQLQWLKPGTWCITTGFDWPGGDGFAIEHGFICEWSDVPCQKLYLENIPKLSAEDAEHFMKFMFFADETDWAALDFSQDEMYRFLTGDLSDYGGDLAELRTDVLTLTSLLRARNGAALEKTAQVSDVAVDRALDIAKSMLPDGCETVLDVSEAECREAFGKYVSESMNKWLECDSLTAARVVAGEGVLDEIASVGLDIGANVADGYGKMKTALQALGLALHGIGFIKTEQLNGLHTYFDFYLENRGGSETASDFKSLYKSMLDDYASQIVYLGLGNYGITSKEEAKSKLNAWAEYVYQVEDYIRSVKFPDQNGTNVTHDWSKNYLQKSPTCTTKGEYGKVCKRCGLRDTEEIPATGHETMTKTYAVTPTCINTGNIAYWTCAACGNHYKNSTGTQRLASTDAAILPINSSNHISDQTLVYERISEGLHSARSTCNGCGELASEETQHCVDAGWDDLCDLCGGKMCDHVSTTQTINYQGDDQHTVSQVCDQCGLVVFADLSDCADDDGNSKCDVCGNCLHTKLTTKYENNHGDTHVEYAVCVCGKVLAGVSKEHTDANSDKVCDLCGGVMKSVTKFNIPGSNMTLGNELEMNVMFSKSAINNAGTELTAYVTHHSEDGDVVHTFSSDEFSTYGSSYYKISFRVNAAQMTDTIEVEFKDADGYVYNNDYTNSVRNYVMSNISRFNSYIQTLMVDMLNYGAAAQNQFSYHQDDYANAQLTDAQKALATGDVKVSDLRVKGTKYAGSTLSLQDRILLNLVFNGKFTADELAAMNAVVTFDNALDGKTQTHEHATITAYGSGRFQVTVDQFVLADASQPVTVTVYNADGTVYGSATDSVSSYIYRMDDGSNPMYPSIMKFAASALDYGLYK